MTSINTISFLIVAVVWIVCTVLLSITSGAVNENHNKPASQGLPGESANWENIRLRNKLYIDKTKYLKELISSDFKIGFITRPRRFGKTIFLQMIKSFFEGRKELFHGLSIEDYGNTHFLEHNIKKICDTKNILKWMKFPIIHLNFGDLAFSTSDNFENIFTNMLVSAGKRNKVDFTGSNDKSLRSLIILLYETKEMPVILLIDEFDKPIQDASMKNDKDLVEYLKVKFEKIFFDIKASDEELGFAFMVGIARLPNSAFQSGANNFEDLSYDIRFAQAFGFTQEEIKNNMRKYLDEFAKEMKSTVDDIMKDLLSNYNGYCFQIKGCSDTTSILNPISTIHSLTHKNFKTYWYRTCSINYILKMFYKYETKWHVNDFDTGYIIDESEFSMNVVDAFSEANFPIYLLLFGYTTIKNYDKDLKKFTLAYPNAEIKNAVQEEIINYVLFADTEIRQCGEQNQKFSTAMKNGNFKAAMKLLQEYAFIRFEHPSADNVTPQEITRRFSLILHFSGIKFREGVTFNKDDNEMQHAGDIDFLTLDLNINMLILIKCSINAGGTGLNALKQLKKYYEVHPKNFIAALKKLRIKTEHLYFIGIGFVLKEGGIICEWVVLPLKDGSFDYSHLQAYPETIKQYYQTTRVIDQSLTVANKDNQLLVPSTKVRPDDLNDEDLK